MPLTIRLEDVQRRRIAERFDTTDVLLRSIHAQSANGEIRLLRHVDPYGDTVFNGLQARDVVTEIDELRADVSTDDLSILSGIRDLAEQCASGVHLFLMFYGD
jgi:hypothetical protein